MGFKFIERSFFSLGTLNHIKIFNCEDESLLDLAQKRVNEINDRMSAFKPDSDISKINNNSGKGFVNIQEDTLKLLVRAIEFSQITAGAFDITIRPLVELWGIGKKNNFIPSDAEIENAKKLVNYKNIVLDCINCRAMLEKPGQALDLGGIAKGFAADEVKRILIERNVDSAIINLGGNIITIGNRPNGSPWQIGIQDPLSARGKYVGILSLSDKTVVTSGSNERFFIKDGIRYHHILDPRTGKPANSSILSVTAVTSCSMDADAITTALFIHGMEAINTIRSKLKDSVEVESVYITKDLDIVVSDGLKEKFKVLEFTE